MAATNIRDRVIEIVCEQMGASKDKVTEATSFINDLGADSLDTVELVMELRGNDYPHHLSFQSRVGPVEWLQPYTQDKLAELGKRGVKSLLVVPVAFVTDHIETLHEIDIELREEADHAGIKKYEVMFALNAEPAFIAALADVVEARYLGKSK